MICRCGNYIEIQDGRWMHVSSEYSDTNHHPNPWTDATYEDIVNAFKFWILCYQNKSHAMSDIKSCLEHDEIANALPKGAFKSWSELADGNLDYFLDEKQGVLVRLNPYVKIKPESKRFEFDFIGVLMAIFYLIFMVWTIMTSPSRAYTLNHFAAITFTVALMVIGHIGIAKATGRKKKSVILSPSGDSINAKATVIRFDGLYHLSSADLSDLGVQVIHQDKNIVLFNRKGLKTDEISQIYKTYA